MFGPLGTPEILFIILLALLVFGPRRLPELGRTVGKAMGEFRRATTELKRSVNTELALEEEPPRPRRAVAAASPLAGEPLPELRPDPAARPRAAVAAPAAGPAEPAELAELVPPPDPEGERLVEPPDDGGPAAGQDRP